MKFQDLFKFNKQIPKEERSFAYTPSGGLSFGNAFNKYNSLNLSAVYRCTELISDSVAMLPIHIKNFVSGEEYYNHPLANVFFDKVGSKINKYNLIKLLIQSCILRGNGYAYIERNPDASVKQIRFLPNETVTVQYNQQTDVLYYTSSLIKGRIEPANMIHIKKNTNNGITGISVLSYADRTIGISNSAENASKSFYDKGCNLSGILTVQGAMTKEQIQNARENWNQDYTDGGSGLAILQGSMSYSPIQVSAEDAQLLQTRQYNIKDIARFFGVPVGLLDASEQRYSLEELNMDFLIHTVQPYISVIEDEFNKNYNRKIFRR